MSGAFTNDRDALNTDDLAGTFSRVAEELRSQYLLGFAPATDGRLHKLDVRVTRPGMTVRARRTYVAPREGGS